MKTAIRIAALGAALYAVAVIIAHEARAGEPHHDQAWSWAYPYTGTDKLADVAYGDFDGDGFVDRVTAIDDAANWQIYIEWSCGADCYWPRKLLTTLQSTRLVTRPAPPGETRDRLGVIVTGIGSGDWLLEATGPQAPPPAFAAPVISNPGVGGSLAWTHTGAPAYLVEVDTGWSSQFAAADYCDADACVADTAALPGYPSGGVVTVTVVNPDGTQGASSPPAGY